MQYRGAVAGDALGYSVSGAGDVNGDGYDDIVLGAPYADPRGASRAGSAYVIFGKSGATRDNMDLSSFSSSDGFRIDGEFAGGYLGRSVSGAGDMNNDGYSEIVLAAPYTHPTRSHAGTAYVVWGQSGDMRSDIDLTSLSTNGFEIFGPNESGNPPVLGGWFSSSAVSGVGDVNGDGYDDILVGAPGAGPNGWRAGSAWIIFGKAGVARGNYRSNIYCNFRWS